jgi:hypothetical protein
MRFWQSDLAGTLLQYSSDRSKSSRQGERRKFSTLLLRTLL